MKKYVLEIGVGAFVLLALLALIFLAFQASDLAEGWNRKMYTVTASFDNIGGLKMRSPITISGVKIGYVSKIDLDQTTFQAVVSMRIFSKYNAIPEDTAANIYTSGLIGSNYIGLSPGYHSKFLKEGDTIETTRSALVLENLISQYLFGMKNKK